jgi:hypothetical protein
MKTNVRIYFNSVSGAKINETEENRLRAAVGSVVQEKPQIVECQVSEAPSRLSLIIELTVADVPFGVLDEFAEDFSGLVLLRLNEPLSRSTGVYEQRGMELSFA